MVQTLRKYLQATIIVLQQILIYICVFNGQATWSTRHQNLDEFKWFQGSKQTPLKQSSMESNLITQLQDRSMLQAVMDV